MPMSPHQPDAYPAWGTRLEDVTWAANSDDRIHIQPVPCGAGRFNPISVLFSRYHCICLPGSAGGRFHSNSCLSIMHLSKSLADHPKFGRQGFPVRGSEPSSSSANRVWQARRPVTGRRKRVA
jgi:hypothetical protein